VGERAMGCVKREKWGGKRTFEVVKFFFVLPPLCLTKANHHPHNLLLPDSICFFIKKNQVDSKRQISLPLRKSVEI
jgi:hypothetical protein